MFKRSAHIIGGCALFVALAAGIARASFGQQDYALLKEDAAEVWIEEENLTHMFSCKHVAQLAQECLSADGAQDAPEICTSWNQAKKWHDEYFAEDPMEACGAKPLPVENKVVTNPKDPLTFGDEEIL